MSNQLTKDFTPEVPGRPGFPGVPGTAPHPAFCIDETLYAVSYMPVWFGPPFFDVLHGRLQPTSPGPGWYIGGHIPLGVDPHVVHTCFPATLGTAGIPPIPGTAPIPADYHQGWTAGAIGVTTVENGTNFQFKFSVPNGAVGVVVGVSPSDTNTEYTGMYYGLYFHNGQVQTYIKGVGFGSAVGYSASDVFAINRVGDSIQWYQNATQLHTVLNTHSTQITPDAALYWGLDAIVGASISTSIDGSFVSEVETTGSVTGLLIRTGAATGFNENGNPVGGGGAGGGGDGTGFGGTIISGADTAQVTGYLSRLVGGATINGAHVAAQSYNAGAVTGTLARLRGEVHDYSLFAQIGAPGGGDGGGLAAGDPGTLDSLTGYAYDDSLITPDYAVVYAGLTSPNGFIVADNGGLGSVTGVLIGAAGSGTGISGYAATFNASETRGVLPASLTGLIVDLEAASLAPGWLNAELPGGLSLQGFGSMTAHTGLNAALPTLIGRAYGSGYARGALPVLTLSGHGTATLAGRLTKTLPHITISAAGTAPRIGRLAKALPATLTLRGASGGLAVTQLPLLRLTGAGSAPSVGRLDKKLPRLVNALVGYSGGIGRATLPRLTLNGVGTAASVGRLNKKLPRPITVVGRGGGILNAPLSKLRITGVGTSVNIGRLTKSLPRLRLTAGYGGGASSSTLPLLTMSAGATAWIVGRLTTTLPVLTFSGSAIMPIVGKLSASLPVLSMVSPGRLVAYLPRLTLEASGHSVLSTEYEAYSVTLIELENGQTGVAVTRYTDYPFDQIVRWKGKYYGVATDGLYELAGDTFAGDPIVSVIETMETDFDSPEFKRTPALYLSGRIGADLDVTVLSREIDENAYPTYRPISKAGATTHRCVFGKGIRAHYFGYRLTNVNGEDFAIDTFTPDIQPLKRRI